MRTSNSIKPSITNTIKQSLYVSNHGLTFDNSNKYRNDSDTNPEAAKHPLMQFFQAYQSSLYAKHGFSGMTKKEAQKEANFFSEMLQQFTGDLEQLSERSIEIDGETIEVGEKI